ncbi:hypothetical protein [Vacuolonema iberomarrocanum]|uniref:hypothetical protein n=1 Tax=Vacuolonema iberomarrocanum TaxID=3454632 RepID=UPI0019F24D3B|nr:hypothetical protein [filamentous cyanobacterium LEGE 07170]
MSQTSSSLQESAVELDALLPTTLVFPLTIPADLPATLLSLAVEEDTPELSDRFVLASSNEAEAHTFTLTEQPEQGNAIDNGGDIFTFVLDDDSQALNIGESETVSFSDSATGAEMVEASTVSITVAEDDGKFELYQDNETIDFYVWDASTLDLAQPTYVLTHGWQTENGQTETNWVNLADSIHDVDPDSNVIFMDWGALGNTPNYVQAANSVERVGRRLGRFLDNQNLEATTTQVIGHSLGAHVSGIAGDTYDDLTGLSVGTIVGLDPAGPLFESVLGFGGRGPDQRLDATDSDRTIAFHTSRTLGFDGELADLDLYVNWDDLLQPGQSSFVGNHGYAIPLFTDLFKGTAFTQPDGSLFNLASLSVLDGRVDVDTTNPVV